MLKQSPRVVVIGAEDSRYLAGGLNRYVDDLSAALDQQGHLLDTIVVGDVRAQSTLGEHRTIVSAKGSLVRRMVRVARAARSRLREADALHVHFAPYAVIPATIARRSGIRLIVSFQGPWGNEARAAGATRLVAWVKYRCERRVYRQADELVCLSNEFAKLLVAKYGVASDRVRVVAPGVDTAHFVPGNMYQAREALAISSTSNVIVTTRRLVTRTGVEDLISATAQMTTPDVVVLVIGDGPEASSLQAQATRLGVSDRVQFMGTIDDDQLLLALQASDVAVVPSRSLEGFGLVLLESYATGTPVIGTDVGGLGNALRQHDVAGLTAPSQPAVLAERLDAFFTNPAMLLDPANCRQVAESYDWETVSRQFVQLYDNNVNALTEDADESVANSIRVVIASHTGVASGAELALARQAPALLDDVRIIFGATGTVVERLGQDVPVEVLPLPEAFHQLSRGESSVWDMAVFPIAWVRATTQFWRRLGQVQPDVVQANGLVSGLYAIPAARLRRIPTIWHIHDRVAPDYFGAAKTRLLRWAVRRGPDVVVANSLATSETLIGANLVRVIPVPVDRALSTMSRESSTGDPLTIVFVGRIARWKGHDVFLRAFDQFIDKSGQPSPTALIVGDALFGGDDEAFLHEIKALSESLALSAQVQFLGHVDDIAEIYRHADIAVHAATIPEPFGAVIVEAMTSGVAIVAANGGGPADIIVDDHNGLLVPPGDSEALALALERLSDPHLRTRLSTAALEVAEHYRAEQLAEKWAEIYRELSA